MTNQELLAPFLEGGIRNTHFFNGRILSAEDLQADQLANRQQHQQLGRALGAGVIAGLEVALDESASSDSKPVLRITNGMAVNRKGQMLALASAANEIKLALITETDIASATAGLFVNCEALPEQTVTRPGVFILTVAPASGFEGNAPLPGFGTPGNQRGCGRQYAVEGVMFRAIPLPNLPEPLNDASGNAATTLRNRLAHFCFGSHAMLAFGRDPLSSDPKASALALLRDQSRLTDCEVPLALVILGSSVAEFVVDMWAARRLAACIGDQTYPEQSLVLATVRQFQKHLEDLKSLANVKASTHFFYLPPIGRLPLPSLGQNLFAGASRLFDRVPVLPIGGLPIPGLDRLFAPIAEKRLGLLAGVNLTEFFENKFNRMHRVIARHELNALFQLALSYPPRAYADVDEIEIYLIADELQASQSFVPFQPQAYFVFAEIAKQFCAPARFISSRGTLDLESFLATLVSTVEAFECLRHTFQTKFDRPRIQITAEDMAGLSAIDQVLSIANTILTAATSQCMSNHALWLNFTRLANQEKNFIDVWLEVVLAQQQGQRYPVELRQTMEKIRPLIVNPQVSDNPGLLAWLERKELYEANVKQNESVNILVQEICQVLRASLYGFVINERREMLPGASVQVFDVAGNPIAQANTNEEGAYRIEDLNVGVYVVSASLAGHVSKTETVGFANLESIRQDFVLLSEGPAIIEGNVSSFLGFPLRGSATITLTGAKIDFRTRTDRSGDYRIEVPAEMVRGQLVTLTAQVLRGGSQSKEFVLTSGTITVDFRF